jgi:hypothetical protein
VSSGSSWRHHAPSPEHGRHRAAREPLYDRIGYGRQVRYAPSAIRGDEVELGGVALEIGLFLSARRPLELGFAIALDVAGGLTRGSDPRLGGSFRLAHTRLHAALELE